MAVYITEKDVDRIHMGLVEMFKLENDPIFTPDGVGVKSRGLLSSACERARISLGNIEKYPNIYEKAAATFHSLVKNHPFHDGNKRTALMSLLVFLDKNSKTFDGIDDEIFEFVVSVAADDFQKPWWSLSLRNAHSNDTIVLDIANWIRSRSRTRSHQASDMKIGDFLEKCTLVGCTYRDSGSAYLVCGPEIFPYRERGSIRIGKSNRGLSGKVVRSYIQRLKISKLNSGVSLEDFQIGIDSEDVLMIQFRDVLKRLANA